MAPRLVLATANPDKAAEMARLLAGVPVRLLSRRDFPGLPEVAETAADFAGNARLKAEALCRATRAAALGDDSGLCVDALDGAPGVRSARWAGADATYADNNTHLLKALAGVPPEGRTARFVCVLALALPGDASITFEGACDGRILDAPRGTRGFGYDPLFWVPEAGRSFAEMDPDQKDAYSHRARAFARARAWLAQNVARLA